MHDPAKCRMIVPKWYRKEPGVIQRSIGDVKTKRLASGDDINLAGPFYSAFTTKSRIAKSPGLTVRPGHGLGARWGSACWRK